MFIELMGYINSIKNPYYSKLLHAFFDNIAFEKKFKFHSAAKSVHHGFVGGLLEHTLAVTKFCDYMATNYPVLNRDLLLAAAMFHDIGKLEELATFPINDYTEEGNFLGHIYMGAETVGYAIRQITNFPTNLALELKHCILAHHGELEYGSPKKPAIVEAVALNFADNADAKLQTFTELLSTASEGETWLGYNKFFESNVRRS
jgi:3'-5' exoribonuclease